MKPTTDLTVLVVGSGGREHALVKSLSQAPSVKKVFVAPGNPGMNKEAECVPIPVENFSAIKDFCLEKQIQLVVIGPDNPLVEGLSDLLRDHQILVFGPSQKAAQLEGSKIFAKEFMLAHKIPTSGFAIVTSLAETLAKAKSFTPPYVLKADGLAFGKGVFICKTITELQAAAESLFVKKIFGPAGERALLEEFIPGYELSYLIFTNGKEYQVLPIAQDHKRLKDFDQGPNTGGMGTIAPLSLPSELDLRIQNEILKPTMAGLQKDDLFYRGVIFLGLMIKDQKPYVLEYNCRFGDPETQVILPLIENDLGEVFYSLSQGQVSPIKIKKGFATCVVLAAPGYPDHPQKGVPISGDPLHETKNSYFIHAGTSLKARQWQVSGGRVMGAIGLGPTQEESITNAYQQLTHVKWDGMQFRKDIGQSVKK